MNIPKHIAHWHIEPVWPLKLSGTFSVVYKGPIMFPIPIVTPIKTRNTNDPAYVVMKPKVRQNIKFNIAIKYRP